jgi:hypothetical protein
LGRIQDQEFRIKNSGSRIQNQEFRIKNSGFRREAQNPIGSELTITFIQGILDSEFWILNSFPKFEALFFPSSSEQETNLEKSLRQIVGKNSGSRIQDQEFRIKNSGSRIQDSEEKPKIPLVRN